MGGEVLKSKWSSQWPIHPFDVKEERFHVPGCLTRLLKGIITGDPVPPPTFRVQSLVKSFKIKPPKQVLLSYGVKTLTGNVELIQILNRLGHGVSYSQLEENDTALCLEKMAAAINESAILPDTIRPNVFTNLAWDNVDRLEETLIGGGTSHRVNGIVFQPKVYGSCLPKPSLPAIRKQKQRSITQEVPSLFTYISGERVGPPQTPPPTESAQHKAEADLASKKNFIWQLTRNIGHNGERQKTPSWTGFNVKTRNNVNSPQDVVGYLPTINAPATEMTTVKEILRRSDEIRKILDLSAI